VHRSYTLSPTHYAAGWVVPGDDQFNTRDDVNALAIEYANLPDGPAKETAFLTLVQYFHGYLMKYTNMVIRGQLPGPGTAAGTDAARTLKTLLPKGSKADRVALSKACRTLHLAFKMMTTDEVYDVMVLCFLRACHRYDPGYSDKVLQVCEVLRGKKIHKQFVPDDITPLVGFDATRYIRLLVGKGYLAAVMGPKRKVAGYKRSKTWPPKPAFFESGPVGFVYFASMWFRYYVSEYISKVMAQLETKEGVLQLEVHPVSRGKVNSNHDFTHSSDALPHALGNFVDQNGRSWAADTALMEQQFDLSEMTDEWVRGTNDRFFRSLTPSERRILQLVFRKEFNWVQIAAMMKCSTQTVRQQYNEILAYLRGHLGAQLKTAA
jgi:hypothetical protein